MAGTQTCLKKVNLTKGQAGREGPAGRTSMGTPAASKQNTTSAMNAFGSKAAPRLQLAMGQGQQTQACWP